MRTRPRPLSLALAATLLVLPATAAAQAADATSLEVGILDVLLERGLIDQAQYEELLALARARAEDSRSEIDLIEGRLERLRAPDPAISGGKPGKLEFRSADGTWSMKIKGRIQARVENKSSDDPDDEGTNFSVPRARLGFEGKAGLENVDYKLEIDASTEKGYKDPASSPDMNVRHAYIDWGFQNGMGLLFGQSKFPFGREVLTSSGSISFEERSAATREFAPEFEPMAMLHGTLEEGEFEYYVAMSNGEGRGKNNTPGTHENGLRKGARVVWNPLGAMKLDGPAFQTVKDNSTLLALGASYMLNQDSSGLNSPTAGTDSGTLGLEAQLMTGPLSVLFENFSRNGDVSGSPDVDDDGRTLQVGCFVDEDAHWEVIARRSEVDYDVKDDLSQTGMGLNYYVIGHSGKWMLNWDKFHYSGSTADSTSIALQYQAVF